MKRFYRVANTDTDQGLWYDKEGRHTGLIHKEFDFCTNSELPMPYDENVIGYLSAVDELTDLFYWFSEEDITQLEEFGYYITIFEATDYKYYNNHWLINQETSVVIKKVTINELNKVK